MSSASFWRIMEQSIKASRGNRDRLIESLTSTLVQLGADAIIRFQRELDARMDEALTWPLWGAAYLLDGGCSDDGFEYFRALLIANGKETFERVVADPDSLAKGKLRFWNGDAREFEELLYVPMKAYEDCAGGAELPRSRPRRTEPAGTQWSDNDLPSLLPAIAKKMKAKAAKACPLVLGQIFRLPLPHVPPGTDYGYLKVIGEVTCYEQGRCVVVVLLDVPPPNPIAPTS